MEAGAPAGLPTPEASWFATAWIAWALVWFVTSFRTARSVAVQPRGSRLLHLGLMAAGAVLLGGQPVRGGPLAQRVLPAGPAIAWTGFGLVLAGIGFTVAARVVLGRFWSSVVTLKEEHALVQRGPYALARHPIYTGLLVAILGTALARGTGAALIGTALLVLALVLKLRREEALLARHFGAAHAEYRKRVRALIPFVW